MCVRSCHFIKEVHSTTSHTNGGHYLVMDSEFSEAGVSFPNLIQKTARGVLPKGGYGGLPLSWLGEYP